jgi:hypothetical protein
MTVQYMEREEKKIHSEHNKFVDILRRSHRKIFFLRTLRGKTNLFILLHIYIYYFYSS